MVEDVIEIKYKDKKVEKFDVIFQNANAGIITKDIAQAIRKNRNPIFIICLSSEFLSIENLITASDIFKEIIGNNIVPTVVTKSIVPYSSTVKMLV